MTDPWAPQPNQPHTPQPLAGEPPTQQIPQRGQYPDPATQQFEQPSYPPPEHHPPATSDDGKPPKSGSFLTRTFRDPLSIVLVVVIVLALSVAGLVGAELYARHRGNDVVAAAVACVVEDTATASFGASPFLIQHLTKHYGNISITTAGNQIRDAKGMKADIEIDDVRLADNGTSKGTLGSLVATITWSTEGIKETIQNSIPLIGSFVTGVKTNPSDGTIELEGALATIVAKPQVVDDGISLEVQELTGLGFSLPREMVQPALDAFTAQLTKGYPLGIHADTIEVTDTGVISKFSTQNATLTDDKGPCFTGI